MIVVLASRLDPAARELVDSWSSAGAALLSAEDLSREGWLFRVGDPGAGTAVVDGGRVAVGEVEAVVTRRPAVLAEELAWIDPGDRGYMAAEANAFLVAWLSALSVPIVNPPTPTSLCGPAWGPHHWAAAAARAGVAWDAAEESGHDVILAGGRCVGARGREEEQAVRSLAAEARVELLGVRFAGDAAVAATTLPPLDEDEAKGALLEHLLRRRR